MPGHKTRTAPGGQGAAPAQAEEPEVRTTISATTKRELSKRHWPQEMQESLGLTVKVPVYVQDPEGAVGLPNNGLVQLGVPWEPCLDDLPGPTSARLAVVDYDGATDRVQEQARFDQKRWCFVEADGSTPISAERKDSPCFRQVTVWGIIQAILTSYEHPQGLGRPIPWGFPGNRLIIVPYAGNKANACYDRTSKSIQFYYYDTKEGRTCTALSHDIVAHEAGHALLDGIRPLYIEALSLETAAFHEFFADLTAILSLLRNNDVRDMISKQIKTGLSDADFLADLAEQFGKHLMGKKYLRTARNFTTMAEAEQTEDPYEVSTVLTGALYEVMKRTHEGHVNRGRSQKQSLWSMTQRLFALALQTLDFCPPADISFAGYGQAMMSFARWSDPLDEHGYLPIMADVFARRGILPAAASGQAQGSKQPRPDACPVEEVRNSSVDAYLYLHRNRGALGIPLEQDLDFVDVCMARKLGHEGRYLPQHTVIQYIWRETVRLEGGRFGDLRNETVSLPRGGTLVFDESGGLIHAARTPGWESAGASGQRTKNLRRRIARAVAQGQLGMADEAGQLGLRSTAAAGGPPFLARAVDGVLRLETAPRLHGGVVE